MTSKQKVILTKQSKHQFQHLLRHYQSALQLTKSGQYLLPPDLFKILDTMGYLCQEKTQKDYELANSLVFLLSIPRGKGTVSQRNLFQFLVTLNNLKGNVDSHFQSEVQPLPKDLPQLEEPLVKIQIGNFDEKGVWLLSKQQEKKVRDIFSNMIYTRVSRQEIKTIKKKDKIESENKQDLFHPFILDKSVRMADHRQKALQLSIRVEDRLLESNDLYHSRLQSSLKKSLQKQIKECSFRPRINSSSNKFGKQNRRQSSEQILLMKGRQYQLRRKIHQQEYNQLKTQAQLSQCKFKPDLSSSSVSLQYSLKRQTNPNIRNGQKAIQRMRVARQQRESLNEFHQRGYPKDQSWRQFMDDLKMKRQKTIAHNTSASIDQSQAIFKIELKLLGQFKIIEVRQGDDILILAHKICKDNRISEDNIEKVFNTIERILRQSGQVQIKNRRVFPFKKL